MDIDPEDTVVCWYNNRARAVPDRRVPGWIQARALVQQSLGMSNCRATTRREVLRAMATQARANMLSAKSIAFLVDMLNWGIPPAEVLIQVFKQARCQPSKPRRATKPRAKTARKVKAKLS